MPLPIVCRMPVLKAGARPIQTARLIERDDVAPPVEPQVDDHRDGNGRALMLHLSSSFFFLCRSQPKHDLR